MHTFHTGYILYNAVTTSKYTEIFQYTNWYFRLPPGWFLWLALKNIYIYIECVCVHDMKPLVVIMWPLLGVPNGYTQVSGFKWLQSIQPVFVECCAKPCHAFHWVVENRIFIVGLLSYWSTSKTHLKSKFEGAST